MKTLVTLVTGLIALCVVLPIWYVLLYYILQSVNASDVMWLLYWIYVPVGIFISILGEIVKAFFTD